LAKKESPTAQPDSYQPAKRARLSEKVSIHAVGRGSPSINLSDGHDLLTSYLGPEELRVALEQNKAQALSLASADFDEDGVADLISGYAYERRGIVTIHRGNVDSIYSNAPEAKQRRANRTFTDAPFLSPARVFDSPAGADFIGAGDFDGDGHSDVIVASRGRSALHLLAGDGQGGFRTAQDVRLPGVLTALTTGEFNRRDGLRDIVLGVEAPDGPGIVSFEGPNGAIRSRPEIFSAPATVTSLALGQFDDDYQQDLAVAAGDQLLLVHGRDRKLSADEATQAGVATARVSSQTFTTPISSLVAGDFDGASGRTKLAVLGDDGCVRSLAASLGDDPFDLQAFERDDLRREQFVGNDNHRSW